MKTTLSMLAIGIALITGLMIQSDSPPDVSGDIERLERIFPVLEKYKVVSIRQQDWCSAFEYSRGSFATNTASNCNYALSEPIHSYDRQARADHHEVWKGIMASKVKLLMVKECTYDAHGALASAVFDRSEAFVRHYYYYKPGYTLPADEPGEA